MQKFNKSHYLISEYIFLNEIEREIQSEIYTETLSEFLINYEVTT